METNKLVSTGLTEQQAITYALLLEVGEITPPQAAKRLGLTRSNAYKVLDKLCELRLAKKSDQAKKVIYTPSNPLALSNLAAEQRNKAAKQEEAVQAVLSELLTQFHSHTEQPAVEVVSGRHAVATAYRNQIRLAQPIYFLRSRADITSMGFDTMHEIRTEPARHGINRYGISPDISTGTTTSHGDERTNLERTWVRQEDYDAPVEWSVAGSSLIIILFAQEPHAITITNPMIASAFMQIWSLLSTTLKSMPYYKELPR